MILDIWKECNGEKNIKLKIIRGIELNKSPFLDYQDKISSPLAYEMSQFLGERMRESAVDGFKFISARDINQGINVGLFNINSFANKQPHSTSFQTWQCNTTNTAVEFIRMGSLHDQALAFSIQNFTMDGIFPFPSIT